MPFVQGHLSRRSLDVTFRTECAHCHRPMRLQVDSDLHHRIDDGDPSALVFVPLVSFAKVKDPSIIDVF
jgi:hypothetical protein